MSVRVEMGRPENGWMTWTITAKERVLSLRASNVLSDTVGELAGALSLVLKGGDAGMAVFEEPEMVGLRWERAAGGVILVATRYEDHRMAAKSAMRELRVEGTMAEVVIPFWRALRKVQAAIAAEEFERGWERAFPTEKVTEVGELWEAMKGG